jgi:1-acyl-sn-glycerol-3-phosphate acyltransferase
MDQPHVRLTALQRARRRASRGWAGGPPTATPPFAWTALLGGFRLVAAALGLDLRIEGGAHVPDGPCIIAAAPHRTWLDPFALSFALPPEPRLYFLGDGEAMYRDPLRAFFVRRIGGVVPIWRGEFGFASHVEATRRVLGAGARLALFPERGAAVPVDRTRPFAAGVGYIATRTGGVVVPAILGGTHELYLGRRVIVRFLAPIPPPHGVAEGSREERDVVHAFVSDLERTMAPHVSELFERAEPPPTFRKRWRWLTTAFH